MLPIEIRPDIFWVGVNDRSTGLFEGLWPIDNCGISYNAYLIRDEKSALIDLSKEAFTDDFIRQVSALVDLSELDYVIINHMEPDHSGALTRLRELAPKAKFLGMAKAIGMMKDFYDVTENVEVVKHDQTLSLGRHTLRFLFTPLVHWPETMMTYETTDKILFSGDAFGTFKTLDGGITDTQLRPEVYIQEMIRYYSNIVGKYGSPVQKALEKLSHLEIKTICSTHGPVWTTPEDVKEVIRVYDRLSRYEADNGVVIVYGSMYGNTEQLAELIASELAQQGVREIIMHNVSKSHPSYIIRDIFKYKGLIIGSPTYNNQIYPKIESLLWKIQNRDIKNRYVSYFGSFSWAGAAVKRLKAFVEDNHFEVVGTPIEIKYTMQESTFEQCTELAKAMAEKLK